MQTFRVLRCSECGLFQVDIVKKVTKWSCKVCGLKQTVIKIYFTSSVAIECREATQQFNSVLQNQQDSLEKTVIEQFEPAEMLSENCAREVSESVSGLETMAQSSKWANTQSTDKAICSRDQIRSEAPVIQLKKVFRAIDNEPDSFSSIFEPPNKSSSALLDYSSQASSEFLEHTSEPPHKKVKTSSHDKPQSDQDFWNNLF